MASKKTPPCPGNPEDYVLVKTREGMFWRRRRGSIKPAKLNTGFRKAVETTKIIAPAAKRIITALQPYLRGLRTGRINIRVGNALRRSLKEKNRLLLSYLKGVEVQAEYPLDELLTRPYNVYEKAKILHIEIPIEPTTVRPLNRLVTHYYFEAVLLYGAINKERELKTACVESPLYSLNNKAKTVCVLELPLPEKDDWCVLLKLSFLEGNELAVHTKHYRTKVIEGKKEL